MARIRTIKPEFFASETIARLSHACRLTFIGMWTEADDYGNLVDNPRLLKGHLWALEDDITPTDLSMHIQTLLDAGLIDRYEGDDGKRHLHVRSWEEHQRMNRRASHKVPASPWDVDAVPTQCATPAPVEIPRKKQRSTETTSTADALPTQCGSSVGSGSGSGSGKGSGGGSGSAASPQLPNPFAAMNGSTTTTFNPDMDTAMRAVSIGLARLYARDGEEAAYASSILRKPSDHTQALAQLFTAHPHEDANQIAERYLNSRKPAEPKQPKCGVCGADAHPNGPIDCPRMAS